MPTNFYMFFVTALVPLLIGALWYSPLLFHNKWMSTNGFTEDSLKKGNMAVIFALSYLFGLFISFALSGMVIHQTALFQLFSPEGGGQMSPDQLASLEAVMDQVGNKFRTFKHGALHGAFATVFFVFPILAINALFERRGWTYILLHTGYWLVTLVIMGAILCETLKF